MVWEIPPRGKLYVTEHKQIHLSNIFLFTFWGKWLQLAGIPVSITKPGVSIKLVTGGYI